VRRQLDFADADADAGAGAGGDLDDYDDFVLSAVDDIERGYNEAKRRAPPCVCGRGDCAVQRDNKRSRWMYVCSSQPVSLPTHLQVFFSPLLAFFFLFGGGVCVGAEDGFFECFGLGKAVCGRFYGLDGRNFGS
jgi:hypothetical protein